MSAPDPAGDPTPVPEPSVPEPSVPDPLPALPAALPADAPVEAPAARRLPRAAVVALATAGLLAVTAGSAAVTVLVGRPDHRSTVAATAPAAPGASASASPTAGPAASAAPVPLPSQSLVPSPSSTLHGTLSGSTHGGDLRYFLVPIPDGGESYGPADGAALTTDDLAKEYDSSTDIKSVLNSYGYQESVYRKYRTADGSMEVSARLMRFSSASSARQFAANASFSTGDSFDLDGDSGGRGFLFKPDQQAFPGHLIGVSAVGDVEYEVSVDVKGDPDKALLTDAMKRQRDRLSSAG